MGQAGQRRISKFYSLEKLGEATLNHYQSFRFPPLPLIARFLKLLTLSDFCQVGGAAIAANRISRSLSDHNVSITSVSIDARHQEKNSSKLL